MTHGFPPQRVRPEIAADPLSAPFWEAAAVERLAIQRCDACDAWRWGPEWICHACGSDAWRYEETAPTGVIDGWTRIWAKDPESGRELSYYVVVVRLPQAGDIRLIGNLVGTNSTEPRIGVAVQPVFDHRADADGGYTLIQWQIVNGLDCLAAICF